MKSVLPVAIVCLLFISLPAYSNTSEALNAEHVSLEQGIPNNLIFSMMQDRNGLLWFGTMFGLFRYDGKEYKTFRYNPTDTNSLSNDDVTAIYEDRDGKFWIGTYNGGLNMYDPLTGMFTRYLHKENDPGSLSSNTVWDIDQDRSGTIWIATNGGGLCKLSDGKFTAFRHDTASENSLSGDYIRTVSIDSSGNIWAGTFGSGVNKLDPANKTFVNYRFDQGSDCRACNFISSIITDKEGTVWIGNGNGKLFRFDEGNNEFTSFEIDKDKVVSENNQFVNSILEPVQGKFLVGTGSGLYEFEKNSGYTKRSGIFYDGNKDSKPVISMVLDKSGVLWISSYLNGLYKVGGRLQKFNTSLKGKNILCVYEDRNGILWAGSSREGLFRSSDGGKNFSGAFQVSDPNSMTVNSVCEDERGNIWIGTSGGLYTKTPLENTFRLYDSKQDSLSSKNILKLIFAKNNILWIGTDKGLNKLNLKTDEIKSYYHSDDPHSLSDNTILSLYEDIPGNLWVGTFGGLNVMEASSDNFRHFIKDPNDSNSISNNYAFSYSEDSVGNLWIGTGGGLNLLNPDGKVFTHFRDTQGLQNDVIAGMEFADDGVLWISTYKGITRFNRSEMSFKTYDAGDGLAGNMFNNGSYFRNKKGVIYFGCVNGLNYFDPNEVHDREFKAPVAFTTLTKFDDNARNEIDITKRNEIELDYKDNFIKINFASVDFTNPEKNLYSYMLVNWDEDWISVGNSNSATYTNLSPGKYFFKVRATNSDGVWNEDISSITIIIKPPFWKTWWFYMLVFCFTVSAIILIHIYRVRSRVKKLLEVEEIRQNERELMREQAARDYHDELGHKLTRISLYSRRIDKKLRATANGLTQDLNSIVETTNSLQSGAKDLIWAMNPNEDSLYDMIIRLKDFGNELFEGTGITFQIEGIKESMKVVRLPMNLKRHLIFIFKEAMNNSLKYSRCDEVRMEFNMNDIELRITLKDNGCGFDVCRKQTGYGLKNIDSRAKQINSEVTIVSNETSGTEIALKIPVSHLIKN